MPPNDGMGARPAEIFSWAGTYARGLVMVAEGATIMVAEGA